MKQKKMFYERPKMEQKSRKDEEKREIEKMF